VSGTAQRILVIEDERAQREPLARYLTRSGFSVVEARSGEEGVEALGERDFSVLLTDLRLPGIDGLEVIRRARLLDPQLGIILITAYASVESAVEALRLGAHDYILKPLMLEEVGSKIAKLLEHREVVQENARLRGALQAKNQERTGLVADSKAMQDVMSWVARAAVSKATVLVLGETGVGKEVVARALHSTSAAAMHPFLPVNLAAIPEAMIESELFGHEKGAFTGAGHRREGLFRAAAKGTVFLDEIAEMPYSLQPKLLRALEAREVFPLGSDSPVPFHARIMAATHRALPAMVEERTFREDLYYRLNILPIRVPPLRERLEDLPGLVHHLLERQAKELGGGAVGITPEALRLLLAYRWPGNIRELSNVLERARVFAGGGQIEIEHLPVDLRDLEQDRLNLQAAVERYERGHIASVLKLCTGNRERAAQELGISPATLYRRIEKLGLKGFETGRGDSQD
jgi:two-component system, NtrC family, response regulator AtoC